MRHCAVVAIVLAAALALAPGDPARAATPAPSLPEHLAGHISVKSPMALLAAVDDYVSTAMEGTPQAVPPGLITMLASVYLPLPLDAWNADEEAHVALLPAPGGVSDAPFVFVFANDGFEQLVEGLEAHNWLVGDTEENGVTPVAIPGGGSMALADLGGGRAALAVSAEHIRAALTEPGWTPVHASDADVSARFALNRDAESLVDRTAAYIARRSEAIADAISQNGIKPDVARRIAEAMAAYAPRIVQELEQAEELLVELRSGDDALTLDLGARFAEGSLARELADSAAAAPELDLALAERFSRDAVAVGVTLAGEDLLENARQRYVSLNADLYGRIWPGLKDKMAALADSYFQSGPGQSASATYRFGEREATVSLIRAENPEALERVLADAIQELNALWNASIDTPDLAARFAGELKNSGSQVYNVYRLWFDKDRGEAFQAFLDRLSAAEPELRSVLRINHDFRIYLSRVDDAAVLAVGDMQDDEFTAILSGLNRPAAEPLFATPAAQRVLPGIAPARASVGLIDADGVFRLVAAALVREMDANLPSGKTNPYRTAFETARLQNRGDVFGVALRGENGLIVLRSVLPAEAVNTLIRDYEAFRRIQEREARRAAEPQSDNDGEDETDTDADAEEVDAA